MKPETIQKIKDFRDSRDWKKFHNGKDLALALSIEAAELNEAFLWKDAENVKIENILNVLRALSLLANFDVLVPEQEIVPTIVIERRVKRQRVRHKKANEDKIEIEWKWGDES